ncbi:hypothetical protein PTSG_09825 [Salpingoeca rosetta]|uniref:Transmembrane protein n=1 Tax=Salpingoeca rosetta (strain ATCC 50818 / BSB-021) TaxID=946362 RepID=F2UP58_SALR5|nr:uncharacterized protein PTSG_09825 [Salpingoeca rosetta]EGD79413.1 hypothetical protein PTSG_09825 [Salpingoeca rosetta]|eukprot:XP_004989182.1 hypothetical protein PTSG_09825 [Salpingoeca rosetta]
MTTNNPHRALSVAKLWRTMLKLTTVAWAALVLSMCLIVLMSVQQGGEGKGRGGSSVWGGLLELLDNVQDFVWAVLTDARTPSAVLFILVHVTYEAVIWLMPSGLSTETDDLNPPGTPSQPPRRAPRPLSAASARRHRGADSTNGFGASSGGTTRPIPSLSDDSDDDDDMGVAAGIMNAGHNNNGEFGGGFGEEEADSPDNMNASTFSSTTVVNSSVTSFLASSFSFLASPLSSRRGSTQPSFFTPASSPVLDRFTPLMSEDEYIATRSKHTRQALFELRQQWSTLDEHTRRRIVHRRQVESFAEGGAMDLGELEEDERGQLRTDIHAATLLSPQLVHRVAESRIVELFRFKVVRFLLAVMAVVALQFFFSNASSFMATDGDGVPNTHAHASALPHFLLVGSGNVVWELVRALVLLQLALTLALRFRGPTLWLADKTGALDLLNSVLSVVLAGDARPLLALLLNPVLAGTLLAITCAHYCPGTATSWIAGLPDMLHLPPQVTHVLAHFMALPSLLLGNAPLLPVTLVLAAGLFLGHRVGVHLASSRALRATAHAHAVTPRLSLASVALWTFAAHVLATVLLLSFPTPTRDTDDEGTRAVAPLFASRADTAHGPYPWLRPVTSDTSSGGSGAVPAFDVFDVYSAQFVAISDAACVLLKEHGDGYRVGDGVLAVAGLATALYGHTLAHAAVLLSLVVGFNFLVAPACYVLAHALVLSWPSLFYVAAFTLPLAGSAYLALVTMRSLMDRLPGFLALVPAAIVSRVTHPFYPHALSVFFLTAVTHVNFSLFGGVHALPALLWTGADLDELGDTCEAALARYPDCTGPLRDRCTRAHANQLVADLCDEQAAGALSVDNVQTLNVFLIATLFAMLCSNAPYTQAVGIAAVTAMAGLAMAGPLFLPLWVVEATALRVTVSWLLVIFATAFQLKVAVPLTRGLHLDATHASAAQPGLLRFLFSFAQSFAVGAAIAASVQYMSPFEE